MNTDPTNIQSQAEAARVLQETISDRINAITFPAGLQADRGDIRRAIMQNVDASSFDKHNQDGIVEARAIFQATRSDGAPIFNLKIIWELPEMLTEANPDADNPPVDSNQTAHYGWEILLDDTRVAGPGHVFFAPEIILTNFRLPGLEMKEDSMLKLQKSGTMGTGNMESETHYFRVDLNQG